MKISFVAGFGPIVSSTTAAASLYRDALAIPFDDPDGDYLMTNSLEGVKHFGIWTLEDCAKSCFGTTEWPSDRPKPQGGIEFDVESPEAVSAAADELKANGYDILVGPKEEPWGQTVARFQSPEGLLLSITYTPPFHE